MSIRLRALLARLPSLPYPIVLLIGALQRSPVVRLAAEAEEALSAAPIAAWIRSAAITVAALGGVDALAGASVTVTATPNGGFTAPAGQPVTGAAFTLNPRSFSAESWTIVSGLPPGLAFDGNTAYGTFDTSQAALKAGYTLLSGTPTTAGTYPLDLVAYEYPGGSATNGNPSAPIQYTITITAVAPVFNTQPVSQTVAAGATVVFFASASGSPTYQWNVNGAAIGGANSSRLVLSNVSSANAGAYTCTATNAAGPATSQSATLTVTTTTDPGHLTNLSVLNDAGSADSLTAGFYTGGLPNGVKGSQTLLVRVMGPSLQPFGVTNFLPDPTLTLNFNGTLIASNDNWNTPATNGSQVTAADNATGAFAPESSSSLDAALVVTEPAGGYTAIVGGNGASSGTALAEVYDDTPGQFNVNTTPRLTNISAKTQLAAGATLTAGFSMSGATAKTLLIRAVGPTLANFGVSGFMPDPELALHTTIKGQDTVLATNQGWGGDPQIAAAASSVGAFALNFGSADSVLLITLQPGTSYTAQATSASGQAGVVLVEVYEVP